MITYLDKFLQITSDYLAEFLRTCGFSYQEARFVSHYLDKDQRHSWVTRISLTSDASDTLLRSIIKCR